MKKLVTIYFLIFFIIIAYKNAYGDLMISPSIIFKIIDLEYIEEDSGDKVIINYSIENIDEDQLIKASNHDLEIQDLLDNKLIKFSLEKDLYIKKGETKFFNDSEYVVWVSSARIKDIPFEDLVFKHIVHKVVKEDNSIWEYKNNLLKS